MLLLLLQQLNNLNFFKREIKCTQRACMKRCRYRKREKKGARIVAIDIFGLCLPKGK